MAAVKYNDVINYENGNLDETDISDKLVIGIIICFWIFTIFNRIVITHLVTGMEKK